MKRERPIWEYFVYDGVPSLDYNVKISDKSTYGAPERDVDVVSVPGRNGDLIFDNGRYANASITYDAYLIDDFDASLNAFRDFLLAHSDNYYRLEDTLHNNEYRMARYSGDFNPNVVGGGDAGSFDIKFDVKPQRFLKSGEAVFTLGSGHKTIHNPTFQVAKPLIKAYLTGAGQIKIGNITITIAAGSTGYICIDSDSQECYEGTVSRSGIVSFSDHKYPEFAPGDTGVEFSGTITKLEIVPRWWRI